jgi:HD-GYP domain-containing protein (c-di-GMP phosphodiesterase class II)
LFENLQASNQKLQEAYQATLEGWVQALDMRDKETEGHTQRVTILTERLARSMGVEGNALINIIAAHCCTILVKWRFLMGSY